MTWFAAAAAEGVMLMNRRVYLMHGYEIHGSITYPWPDSRHFEHLVVNRLAQHE